MSSSSLCPGYRQVQRFEPQEDCYEEGEEVSYVMLDLGNVEPTLVPSSTNYRLIGLDTATPFLQLSGTIFKGRHDSLLGTELLFRDEQDGADTQEWNKRSVVHVANAEQRICFKEVRLKQKGADDSNAHERKRNEGNTTELPKEVPSKEQIDRMTGLVMAPARGRGSGVKKNIEDEDLKVNDTKGKRKEAYGDIDEGNIMDTR